MESYQLTTKWGEPIHKIQATSIEEATDMFSLIKQLPIVSLKRLFVVKKIT
jgi:hypothetical protein